VLPRREESIVRLPATAEAAFAWLDDFRQLSAHMERRSGMMMGSRMRIEIDEGGGRRIGSRVRMSGTMLGMRLALEEMVTLREPPLRKKWRTLDTDLLVIGPYELGFALEPDGRSTTLRVRIDYDLPERGLARWLGRLFGRRYERWCTERMAQDAARHFALLDSAHEEHAQARTRDHQGAHRR
jgi:hypothetical protein